VKLLQKDAQRCKSQEGLSSNQQIEDLAIEEVVREIGNEQYSRSDKERVDY